MDVRLSSGLFLQWWQTHHTGSLPEIVQFGCISFSLSYYVTTGFQKFSFKHHAAGSIRSQLSLLINFRD